MHKVIIGLSLLFLSCLSNTDKFEGQSIDDYVKHNIGIYKPAGISVVAVKDGKELYKGYYGEGITEKSIFPVASLSKVITSIAVMQLVQDGKISLNDDISKHIPELKINRQFPVLEKITIKDLLNHYSGLPADLSLEDKEHFYDLVDVINREVVWYKPRELFCYSNVNYTLLGIIISKISGMKFEEYIDENVLKPINMSNSSFDFESLNKKYAVKLWDGKDELSYPLEKDIPAGGFYTTADDMEKLMTDLLSDDPKLLNKDIVDLMMSKQNRLYPMSEVVDIGLCFWIGEYKGYKSYHHYGDQNGVHSIQYFVPELNFGITIMINSENGKDIRYPLVKDIISYVISDFEEEFIEELKTPAKYLDAFQGTYAGFPGHVVIDKSGENLKMKLFGINLHLNYIGNESFKPQLKVLGIPINIDFLNGVTFRVSNEGGEYKMAPYIDDSFLGYLEKVDEINYPQEWWARVGEYSNGSSSVYTVKYNKKIGYFTVSYSWAGLDIESILKPVSRNSAVTVGHAQNCGQLFMFGEDRSFRGDHNLKIN